MNPAAMCPHPRSLSSRPDFRIADPKPDVAKFFWPGDADLWVFSFLSYPTEIRDAQDSARILAEFLGTIPGLRQISLIGHSMGCRLVLEMLSFHAQRQVPNFPEVCFVLLAAAAVPVALVERGGNLRDGIAHSARRVLVLYSPEDLVLRFAFPAGQSLAFAMRYEGEVYLSAVGLHGSPQNFGNSRKQLVGAGHGDYWGSELVARDIMTLMGMQIPLEIPSQVPPVHQGLGYRLPEAHLLPDHDRGR